MRRGGVGTVNRISGNGEKNGEVVRIRDSRKNTTRRSVNVR